MQDRIIVAALYKFVALDDFATLKTPFHAVMLRLGIKGTLLLAPEGLNGTISGAREAMDKFLQHVRQDPRLADIEVKESLFDENPFYRTKVKLKREIVTLGAPGLQPSLRTGTFVEPEQWNSLIADRNVLLIDVRNDYEVELGSFERAVDPRTKSFGDFTEFTQEVLCQNKQRPIAMFCTGGIRCEKASSYLLQQGFQQVYQLKGGILNYLAKVSVGASKWHGACFVFDQRVGLVHGLEPSGDEICFGCRMPLRSGDKNSPFYEEGVSCPRCHDQHDARSKASARERQKQVKLAQERHLPKPFGPQTKRESPASAHE